MRCRRVDSPILPFPEDPFDAQRLLLAGLGVETSPTILDVGAHMGETVDRYKAIFADSTIYCFEPFPSSISVLNERYESDPSVKVIPMAVADAPGTRVFHANELDATNSLLPRPMSARRYYPKEAGPKATMQVNVTTIDAFVKDQRIENIHILKLDIQGGELMAFQGAVNTLKGKNVPLIYTEAMFTPHYEGNPLFDELWSFLAHLGYSLFDLYQLQRARNGQLRFGDALLVSREMRETVINTYQEEP